MGGDRPPLAGLVLGANFVFARWMASPTGRRLAGRHGCGSHFAERPVTGLRAMGRVYAGWAMSQAFYREKLYLDARFPVTSGEPAATLRIGGVNTDAGTPPLPRSFPID